MNPTSGQLYFTHTDRLGAPQKLTDSTQAVAWSALYQPFGGATFTGTLTTQSLRLPGQQFDAETGLYHNGFRDYSPGLTRYVESDPIGLAGEINTFQYVKGNPFKYIDPWGLSGGSMAEWTAMQILQREEAEQAAEQVAETEGTAAPAEGSAAADASAAQARTCPLRLMHSEDTILSNPRFNTLNDQTDQQLIDSLAPDAEEPLTVGPDGTIFQGNTRIYILQGRGVDVNSLSSIPYQTFNPADHGGL